MQLSNEFTVGADVERVWNALIDMEGVASCLPGASIHATEEKGTYNGSMRVKIGPMTVTYEGTATFTELDEQARRAVISLRAREAKGQGTAMATITNRVEAVDGGARVVADTDLHVTGPQARFGRGVMENVGSRVLGEFSRRLEQKVAGPAEPAAEAADAAAAGGRNGSRPQEEDEALDMGQIISGALADRVVAIAVTALIALLALAGLRRLLRR